LHQFDKTVVGNGIWELFPELPLNVMDIKVLEGPYAAQMEQNGDGNYLAG